MLVRSEDYTKILDACNSIHRRTIWADGYAHGTTRIFDACMRVFDREGLSAEAITFRVYLTDPLVPGWARVHRDGTLEMGAGDAPED